MPTPVLLGLGALVQVGQGSGRVGALAQAVAILPFAAADAAVVEAEAGDARVVQGPADGDDHVVVHVAAV